MSTAGNPWLEKALVISEQEMRELEVDVELDMDVAAERHRRVRDVVAATVRAQAAVEALKRGAISTTLSDIEMGWLVARAMNGVRELAQVAALRIPVAPSPLSLEPGVTLVTLNGPHDGVRAAAKVAWNILHPVKVIPVLAVVVAVLVFAVGRKASVADVARAMPVAGQVASAMEQSDIDRRCLADDNKEACTARQRRLAAERARATKVTKTTTTGGGR